MDPFSEKNTLSNYDIQNFCKYNDIPANIITLEEFNLEPDNANKFCVIYTGDSGNKYNTLPEKTEQTAHGKFKLAEQKLTHHWLGLYGNKLFDSYGYGRDYIMPSFVDYVKNWPSRLQEFDSVCCGEYVLAFLYYCKQNKASANNTNLGRDFCHEFDFGTDRRENDEKVIAWYKKA